ncbi:glycine cleavage H-protein-domain-containing protein [Lasiosphaeria miniovina]|uniref:Glycine cleavage system H protein n=1 Tax=Lasiosphaeria miniovina TaxID=1954250 RepID=A0AA40B5E4_9PEZI|nr:glycine cleavage H-protein-domain-containing protein [Lasiosphaeria miniovina]KAK0727877.1 glycine cleavage H-protein-domain-containing protein [Lasiosphaeria miniovina]
MASIARYIRSARPSGLAALAQSSVSRRVIARPFSVTATNAIRKYTKEHEWIDVAADKKTGVIGISDYAAKALGDVVFVELPELGKKFAAGDAIGAVESVKSAADINAPISCTISHVNLTLEEKPNAINQVPEDDSHGGGWICKVTVSEQGIKDLDNLMTLEAYDEFTATEGEEEH